MPDEIVEHLTFIGLQGHSGICCRPKRISFVTYERVALLVGDTLAPPGGVEGLLGAGIDDGGDAGRSLPVGLAGDDDHHGLGSGLQRKILLPGIERPGP